MTSNERRAAFEAHVKQWAKNITGGEHEVSWGPTGNPFWAACGDSDLEPEWLAYQASHDAAVEACAEEIEDMDDDLLPKEIAAAILRLKVSK